MTSKRLTPLERCLRLFTDVRPGEGPTGLVMLAAVFLILAAYYFIKPAREGFLAASEIRGLSEVELKAYSSFGQSLLLLGVIPLYDRISVALSRRALVTWIPLFFVANLVGFWSLQPGLVFDRVPFVGVGFYLWVGVFNVFIVAQFWSFAADIYSDERGRRLFPMIAIGATAGGAAGSGAAEQILRSEAVGSYTLLLVGAALLASSIVFLRIADRRSANDVERTDAEAEEPPDLSGGLRLVFRHRILIAAAFLILALNWVNTNGENLLFGAVQQSLGADVEARGLAGEAADRFLQEHTTAFYTNLFFWVNLIALVLQAFVASRLLKYGGFAVLLLLLPVISLVSYSTMAIVPMLAVIRAMKIAENSTDYSIHNTAKQVFWLPLTREMKYKAKAAIDTVFVRFGDGLAAITAFVGTNLLDVPLRLLFAFNALVVVFWLGAGIVVVREHRRWAGRRRVSRPS